MAIEKKFEIHYYVDTVHIQSKTDTTKFTFSGNLLAIILLKIMVPFIVVEMASGFNQHDYAIDNDIEMAVRKETESNWLAWRRRRSTVIIGLAMVLIYVTVCNCCHRPAVKEQHEIVMSWPQDQQSRALSSYFELAPLSEDQTMHRPTTEIRHENPAKKSKDDGSSYDDNGQHPPTYNHAISAAAAAATKIIDEQQQAAANTGSLLDSASHDRSSSVFARQQ